MKKILLVTLCSHLLVYNASAQKSASTSNSGFSFDVFGDSRTMQYLPYKEADEQEARKLMVDMFKLVLPEKVAEAIVQKDVKLIYDSSSHELIEIVMPFETSSEVMTLTIDKGWVTSASVEDIKLLPGVHRTMYRVEGGRWVAKEVTSDVRDGKAKFILNTGDLVWWGMQADKPSNNPYWKIFKKDILRRLPAPDEEMKKAGLEGRLFVGPGNHEVWADSTAEGLRATLPYLSKLGLSRDNFVYKFDFRGTRFIFLWTGPYDYRQPSSWTGARPPYAEQMVQLTRWLDEAKSTGIKNVFIAFHDPVICRAGMGPIPEAQNPRKLFAPYAKDLDIVVFNGHVHTTELFQADGVKYFVLGGGGAEQDPILPGRTKIKNLPADYPADLYWKGEPPKEEYNYLRVEVIPGKPTKFTINRFRPQSAEPFESIEVFNSNVRAKE